MPRAICGVGMGLRLASENATGALIDSGTMLRIRTGNALSLQSLNFTGDESTSRSDLAGS